MILDTLMIILWSVTYVLIIINQITCHEEQKMFIPYLAVSMNLAWEINAAVQSHGFWGHLLWLGLDLAIFYFSVVSVWQRKRKFLPYPMLFILITVMCAQQFFYIFRINYGMLLSSFTINAVMSLLFVLKRENVSDEFRTAIAVFKMLGTLCATVYYGKRDVLIGGLGVLTFAFDLFYLAWCLEMTSSKKKKGVRYKNDR